MGVLNEKKYYSMIPDKSATTYHTYYSNLIGKLKKYFDKIQYNNFWDDICDYSSNCIKLPVTEMNEIYYSNPKPNFTKQNLYGVAANLIPHTDCILFNFARKRELAHDFWRSLELAKDSNGICFYRIIIGLTDKNNDTSTEFINLNLEYRGDYMIFDFDRTLH